MRHTFEVVTRGTLARALARSFVCSLVVAAGPVTYGAADAALSATAPLAIGAAQDSVVQSEDDTRALKRILHLEGGRTLRVIARKSGEAWELKNGADWRALPIAMVRSVELEKDVLARFQKDLRAALRDEGNLDARAAVAARGFDEGVAQEALDATEVILRDHPGHAATRAVLVDRMHLFGVPDVGRDANGAVDFEPVLRFGAQHGRSLREAAVAQLARSSTGVGERDVLRAALARDLGVVLSGRRGFAALTYGQLFPGEETRTLMIHALRDTSEDVRGEAARALGAAGEPGLVLPFVKVLERSASPSMRRHAAEALGNLGFPGAVEPLVARLSALAAPKAGATGRRVPHQYIFTGRQFAYIQDFDVEVAQLQSVADPLINVLTEGAVLDVGVIGTLEEKRVVAAERTSIQRALERLTGERPGGNAASWIDWWERQAVEKQAPEKIPEIPSRAHYRTNPQTEASESRQALRCVANPPCSRWLHG